MQLLPIDPLLTEIAKTIEKHRNVILTATPGAGKTTRLPPELLSVVKNKIVVLQPRRMAAVSACYRIAEERKWNVGEQVGYQVRFESKFQRDTRLLFMTDALLLRKMVEDPELQDVGLIVLDEFHERNLNQDLILGAVRELQELGRDIKILVMSATLDVKRLQMFLTDSPHVDVPGKVFPLSVRYSNRPLSFQTDNDFYDRVAQAVMQASKETSGDILVFLPGTGEIRRTAVKIEHLSRDIVSLHGSLSLAEQRKILSVPERPRIILSTNVAEASVTVRGVDYVIDTGLAKVMNMNPHSGFSNLELSRISQFNARQRAGRAAREKPGIALRLWTEHEERTQLQEMPPEVQRVDLTSALLWLAQMGMRDFENFSWLDKPSAAAVNIATEILRKMKVLTADNELTGRGRRLVRFPLPPRIGSILIEAEESGECKLGARVAAVLSERDFVSPKSEAATLTECDVTYRLGLLEERVRGSEIILKTAEHLEKFMDGKPGSSRDPKLLLLKTQRDRLCRRREKTPRGLMAGGRGVRLDPNSQVRSSEFFVALSGMDLPNQSETSISMASGISKAQLLKIFDEEIEIRESIEFVEEKEAFFLSRVRTLDALPLEEPSLKPVSAEEVQGRLAEILIDKWEWLATQNENLGSWLSRWNFLCRILPEYKSQLGREQTEQALALACFGKKSLREVIGENLVNYVEMSLPSDAVRVLHEQVPAKFTAPSGFSHRIEYSEVPYVNIRLQEIFGLLETPKLVFDKVPITFRLLGPNYRPVQITSDLQNFWRKGYAEVRKELRARYPKHSWPEDPLTAKPEAKGRRRQ